MGWNFSFLARPTVSNLAIPSLWPLSLQKSFFVNADITATYTKILTDTVERTHGIPEKAEVLLWDNCVQDSSSQGLISLLVLAMLEQADLFLVYKPSIGVLRRADRAEEDKIRADYKAQGKSSMGVFVSFRNYQRTSLLRIYSDFEYCVHASLNKTLNLSAALQLKIKDLRSSVALVDGPIAQAQGSAIASALGEGNDVMIDSGDSIDTSQIDTSSAEKSLQFLDSKRAYILSLPVSYVSGIQTPGIGSTGEADTRAVERGLKQYFVSIIKPVCEALFGVKLEFRSQDFRDISSGLEVVKTLDVVSDDLISREGKRQLVQRVLGLDPEQEEKNARLNPEEENLEVTPEPPSV